jgi:enoyl-CoA hydratase
VRAVLVEKDQAPAWRPARLENVTEAMVASYFEPIGANELTFIE